MLDAVGASISFSAEDIGAGVLVPRKKIVWGADGTATDVNTGANALPIQDGGNSITIDGSLTNISGTISLPTGASTLAEQQTQTTALQLIDDPVFVDNAAYADNTSKLFAVGYYFDDVAGTALTENDIAVARIDSKRAQMFVLEDATTRGRKATVSAGGALLTDASATTQPVSGTVAATQSGAWNITNISGTVSLPTGASTLAEQQTQTASLSVMDDWDDGADHARVVGAAAVDAATTGNPVLVAGRASAAAPTDVSADGDVVSPWLLRSGAVSIQETYAGVLAVAGNGASGTGVQRVTIADNSTGVLASIGSITTSVTPGTAAANLGKAQDSAIGATDTGVAIWAVRDDALTTITPADGDYAATRVNARGALWISIEDGAGGQVTSFSGGTQYTEDAAAAANPLGTAVNLIRTDTPAGQVSTDGDNVAQRGTNFGAAYVQVLTSAGAYVDTFGGGTQYTEDVASVADPVGNQLIARRRDSLSAETGTDGDNTALNSTSKGELYVKHVDTLPATQSGTWNIGTVTTVTTLSTITNVVHVDDNAGSLTVDNGGTFAVQATIAAGATAIAKAEDVASADADVGVPAMAVRKAAPANTSGTDGDYEMLQMSAGRLWVDPSGVTLTVASHAVTNAGTFVVQENGAALTSLQLIDDVIVADNAAFTDGTTKVAMAGFIFDETAGTALTENDAAAGRINANRAMVFALEDGATRARYATVTAANALKVDASGVAVPVTDNAGSLTVDNAQLSVVGSGTEAAAMRVTIATDSTGVLSVDDNGGSLTVDGTVTANLAPTTSGGLTIGPASGAKLISAATTNATSVKASAGQVYGWFISNTNASPRYMKLYNKASAPTVGTDVPVMVILIPGNTAGAGAVVEFSMGIPFATGIALALTTGVADADTGAVAANEIVINLLFK